jgi:chloramphenicol-sensitive protein RarD
LALNTKSYYGAAIAAFSVWGFITVPLRLLKEYSSGQILYFRVLLAMVCLFFVILVFHKKALAETFKLFQTYTGKEKLKIMSYIVIGGLLLTTNWLVFIYVVNNINVQTGSFAYLLCPILTAVLGYAILKEPLNYRQWAAILISLASCCLIGVDSLRNLMFSLLTAATYAFYLITQRMIRQFDKLTVLAIQLIISFSLIASLGSSFYGSYPAAPDFYFTIFVLSSIFTVLPLFLNLYALKELSSGTIGILMYINPVLNFAVAFLYFGEKASMAQALAYTLILLSIVLYNSKPKKKVLPPQEVPA